MVIEKSFSIGKLLLMSSTLGMLYPLGVCDLKVYTSKYFSRVKLMIKVFHFVCFSNQSRVKSL